MGVLYGYNLEGLYCIVTLLSGILLGAAAAWFSARIRIKATRDRADAEQVLIKEKLAARENELSGLKSRLNETESSLHEHRAEVNRLNVTKAELETLIGQERKHAGEKIALLSEAGEQLKAEFQNLANRIFEEKSRKFTDQNKINLDGLLGPLREQLGDFKKKVEDVYDKESRDRVSLLNEITNLKDINQRIGREALNLTNALKGENKTQGAWGEVVLERVLEESGLQKGREYDVQVSLHNGEGKRCKPDVIVRLPKGRDVVVDSKVSLKAYESYCSAETKEAKSRAIKAHIDSIRTHIKGLSARNYEELEGVRSLDFVLMFIPVEAAFLAAVEQNRELFSEALEMNIMVVTPSTLLVTLRTIQNIWRYEYQNRNALEIAGKAGDLYNKFVGFVEALEDVGRHIDKAKEAYNTAHKRLTSGSGNLVARTQALKKLGIKTKKQLPKEFRDFEVTKVS